MKRLIVFSLALASLFSSSAFTHKTTTTTGHAQAAKASPVEEPSSITERKVLYWYDPMNPAYKSDKPGIAPDSMQMQLVPRYADEPEVPIKQSPVFYPWWTLGAMVILTGLTVPLLFTRGSPRPQKQRRFDLLQIHWVKTLVKRRHFQLILQLPNFLIFALRESYRMSFRASTFGKGICAYSLPRWPLFGESFVTRIVTVGFFCLYNSLYSQFSFITLQLLISRGRAACFHSTDSWDSPTSNKWTEQHLTDSRPGKNTH